MHPVHTMTVEARRGRRLPGVTYNWCWELKPGPLEVQPSGLHCGAASSASKGPYGFKQGLSSSRLASLTLSTEFSSSGSWCIPSLMLIRVSVSSAIASLRHIHLLSMPCLPVCDAGAGSEDHSCFPLPGESTGQMLGKQQQEDGACLFLLASCSCNVALATLLHPGTGSAFLGSS